MKSIILSLALALPGFAHGAQMEECLKHIFQNCSRGISNVTSDQFQQLRNDSTCKMVQEGDVDNVVIFDKTHVVTFQTHSEQPNRCHGRMATINSTFTDSAAFEGRMFFSTTDKRAYAVGRDGRIFELLTLEKHQSYKSITGVKVQESRKRHGTKELLLQIGKNGYGVPLDLSDIKDRLNNGVDAKELDDNKRQSNGDDFWTEVPYGAY